MPGTSGRVPRSRAGISWLAFIAAAVMVVAFIASQSRAGAADEPIILGNASPFAGLAATTVTNTGASVVSGDLGLSPGSAVTGFPPGTIVNGTEQVTTAQAADAQSDLTTAYNVAAAETPTVLLGNVATIGNGQTLGPGVYNSTSSLAVNGTLHLAGDANSVFVFQAASTLTANVDSTILLSGGVNACNIFWQVGSSATLETSAVFEGSVLALASISVQHEAIITGRMLASTGA